MCGIAGILNLAEGAPPRAGTVAQMLAMIRHRGPDEFGIYLGERAALGSARLSIIDLQNGQQPIGNEDQSLWIVFNGEVFNYVELRRELEAGNHRFVTNTDTEVILHLYEQFGPQCLSKLNGQFAIAIWDERDRSLFLARDRLGVRPLFYTQSGNTLVFGSEIKAILACPGVPAEIDPLAIDQVFTFWAARSPRTCFRGIVELPPAHYLLVKDGRQELRPYWQLGFPTPSEDPAKDCPGRSAADFVEPFRELLVDATRIRLRADVPVGAYLSGGLDSSTIASIVRHCGASHLDTFSIAFSDPKFDESEHQRRMARHLGTEHQVAFTTHADIGRVFPEVIWHTETPVTRTSPAPMFLLSKLVRDRKYKVVLTGEGADEFLAGYDIFKEAKVRRHWAREPGSKRRPQLLRRLYPDISQLAETGTSYLTAFFGIGLTDVDAPDYSHAVRWRNNRRACRFFSDELNDAIAKRRSSGGDSIAYPPDFMKWGPLERGQYLESTIFLSQYLLSSQGDRMGMAHSVEGRFPFLDHRVVEFCSRLPSRLKLRGLTDKYLLRQLAREWLPDEILRRPKRPYRAPIHRSFFNDARLAYVSELLSPERIRAAGLFKPAMVAQLVRKIDQGSTVGETDDMALAGILSSQLVHQQFVCDFKKPAPVSDGDRLKVVSATRSGQKT